jgi:hypothetical protein
MAFYATLSLHSATWHNMVIWFLITFFQYFQVHHYKLEATEVINIAEANAKDMISGGALWELVRISSDCSREDIRSLARKTLSSITTFKSELRQLHINYWLQLYLVLHISSRPTTCEADLLIIDITIRVYPLYQYQYLFVCQKISMCIHESVLVTEISI